MSVATAIRPLSTRNRIERPAPDTLVLANRSLRASVDPASLSRFGDDRWVLTHALHEAHAKPLTLRMTTVPEPYREPVKHVAWLMLNEDLGDSMALGGRVSRPAIKTVVESTRFIIRFCEWLSLRGVLHFADVTAPRLDQYAVDVRHSDVSHNQREDLLGAVLRLWAMRSLLPEADRLPAAPPWDGERIHDVLGIRRGGGENRTPRIHPETMTAVLSWSLRFVEDFADDIIVAFDEYKGLVNLSSERRTLARQRNPGRRAAPNAVSNRLAIVVESYRAVGRGLPGKVLPDGSLAVNTRHLGRLAGGQIKLGPGRHEQILARSGLPIDDDCYLFAPITVFIDGVPWRTKPITWDEMPELARLLMVACYVVIGYLSGQRLGETLNLRRGCIDRDPASGLILLRGKYFKEARDPAGNKIPQGAERPDPWVVVAPVATAVNVMERLHLDDLLFPRTLEVDGRADSAGRSRHGQARNDTLITRDLAIFTTWVNGYCAATGRADVIPPDPAGKLHPARLRRTLAWFIARKPRGMVAAAIQYGHVSVAMTLGYSGSYASGFPDDLAFEQWLAKLETMAGDHKRLQQGEHVSGPAAITYRQRVNAATRFAGRVLRTNREAAALLADPDLQIYQGKSMTCVLDPHKAACRVAGDERDHRRTPDLDDCRPQCGNIARTDRDIAALRQRAEHLQVVVADTLTPPIRADRERRELARLNAIITDHELSAHHG